MVALDFRGELALRALAPRRLRVLTNRRLRRRPIPVDELRSKTEAAYRKAEESIDQVIQLLAAPCYADLRAEPQTQASSI